MNCPIDNTQLVISERQGIEIDYCPQCRGIWLDRGELDKLIERSNGNAASAQHQQTAQYGHDDHKHHDNHQSHNDNHHNDHNGKPRKKESLLGDLFDF